MPSRDKRGQRAVQCLLAPARRCESAGEGARRSHAQKRRKKRAQSAASHRAQKAASAVAAPVPALGPPPCEKMATKTNTRDGGSLPSERRQVGVRGLVAPFVHPVTRGRRASAPRDEDSEWHAWLALRWAVDPKSAAASRALFDLLTCGLPEIGQRVRAFLPPSRCAPGLVHAGQNKARLATKRWPGDASLSGASSRWGKHRGSQLRVQEAVRLYFSAVRRCLSLFATAGNACEREACADGDLRCAHFCRSMRGDREREWVQRSVPQSTLSSVCRRGRRRRPRHYTYERACLTRSRLRTRRPSARSKAWTRLSRDDSSSP